MKSQQSGIIKLGLRCATSPAYSVCAFASLCAELAPIELPLGPPATLTTEAQHPLVCALTSACAINFLERLQYLVHGTFRHGVVHRLRFLLGFY